MAKEAVSVIEVDVAGRGRGETLTLRMNRDICYDWAHEIVAGVRSLAERDPRLIVIDMAKVDLVDSSGLRALLVCRNFCEQAGIDFRLSRLSASVERIMRVSGLSQVFGLPELDVVTPLRRPGVCLGSAKWRTYEHVATSSEQIICVLRDRAMAAATEAGADPTALCDIKIAVGEALTNAFKHGSPRKGVNKIELRCMTCSAAFVVEVEDEGAKFDPKATPEPDPRKLQDHGMGLYLMRQFMDVVDFSHGKPGNIIRMVKWLSGSGSALETR